MTIATVSQPGSDLRIELRKRDGQLVLIASQYGSKDRRLLGGELGPIASGIKGYEQCIQFVVDYYGPAGENLHPEFDLSEMKNPQARRRLLGMAGGLIRSTGMTPEQRKERAMKAALARYEKPREWSGLTKRGTEVKWEATHIAPRRWRERITIAGRVFSDLEITSRRFLGEGERWANRLVSVCNDDPWIEDIFLARETSHAE